MSQRRDASAVAFRDRPADLIGRFFPPVVPEQVKRMIGEAAGDHLGSAWLFGSRARGDHHPGSDWDIAVVVSADAAWRRLENDLRDAAARHWSSTGDRVQFHVVCEANIRASGRITRAIDRDGIRL